MQLCCFMDTPVLTLRPTSIWIWNIANGQRLQIHSHDVWSTGTTPTVDDTTLEITRGKGTVRMLGIGWVVPSTAVGQSLPARSRTAIPKTTQYKVLTAQKKRWFGSTSNRSRRGVGIEAVFHQLILQKQRAGPCHPNFTNESCPDSLAMGQ